MTLVDRVRPHRRAVFVILALLLAVGVQAAFTSARSIYPRVAFPRIAVIAERGEQPVRGMMIGVTKPLEQAISAVPGLLRVKSRTMRGASELELDFQSGAEMHEALSLVRARVASAGLPSDTQLTIEQQTPAVSPVVSFNVVPGAATARDPVARARLGEWVEAELRPQLARLPDAFRVTVQSGDQREYVFTTDPLRLAQAGVTLKQVRDAIADANIVAAVGRSETEGLQYQWLVDGQLTDAAQIADLAIARDHADPVQLRDVGAVEETVAERTMIITGDGHDSVVVSVFLRDGGRVTDLSEQISALVGAARAHVPGGGTIVGVYDQAILVNESIAGVRDAIALGALLAVVVLLLFLGDWRLTFVAGVAIPLSVVLTIALLPLMGESLNLMSLGGLAVAIGLIIDDAIVVTENVARRIQGGGVETASAVATGTQEVLGAIVGSSLTTVVVFLPLVLLDGVVGQFFRSLSISLGASILASMAVSLVVSPLMMLWPALRPRAMARRRPLMTAVQNAYGRLATRAVRHPGLVCAVSLALLAGGGVVAHSGLTTGFLPDMDEGGFVLDYLMPVGSSLGETDAVCKRIEAVLHETESVASFSRRTGAELGFFATEQFKGDFLVGLKPRAQRTVTVQDVIKTLRTAVAVSVPQAEVKFVQVMQDTLADLEGNPAPIEVRVVGADYASLQRTADVVKARMETLPGVTDVKSEVSFGSPELVWRPDAVRAARAGLSATSIADQTVMQTLGVVATRIAQGDRFIDVRVRNSDRWRRSGVTDGAGPEVFLHPAADVGPPALPLDTVASFSRRLSENVLERDNQNPVVRVTAGITGRDLDGPARAVERMLPTVPRDAGVRLEMGGQVESKNRSFRSMQVVFAWGGGLVFLLLVAQFRSLRLPLVLLGVLPFGILGGLLALGLTEVPLNVSSGMGLIMLVGLVVKNGIIMIEYAQQLCATGLTPEVAMIDAARVRLRPILMTTLAAIAGLTPLALGLGAGSDLQKPLAVAVIGGLVVSTVFTLVLVPVGCLGLARRGLTREHHHAV